MSTSLGGLDRDMRALVKAALAAGCTLERRTKHLALRLPNGQLVTVASNRNSRADRNLRAALRRAGVQI